MWGNKKKAVTFSFDDGLTHDIKLLNLFEKYNIHATFNINSALLGQSVTYDIGKHHYDWTRFQFDEIKPIYKNHEIAVHTLNHSNLTMLDEKAIIWQVEQDRKVLSEMVGYEVVGMAYPCGGVNNNDVVAQIIKEKTGVKYARTITSTYNFNLQKNLYRFNPTVYWCEPSLYNLVDKFIELNTDKHQLLYIWGHAYETQDGRVDLNLFEKALKKLVDCSDIYIGTNKQVLLNFNNEINNI